MNPQTGVNTQAVESFNNKLKLLIKEKKGVMAKKRKKSLMSSSGMNTLGEEM